MKIVVQCEEKNHVNFDLENDYITMDALKLYFPEAAGLKYRRNNEWHYINFENGKFILKSDVQTYTVHFADVPPKLSIPSKRKFDYGEILNKLKKKSEPQMEEELKKESTQKKKKIGKVKREKTISIGWKHRDSPISDFYKPNSGTKQVTLDVNKTYKVSDIKVIAVNLYKTEYNEKFFENSSSQLCLNNGSPIHEFKSDTGENIWDCKTILDKAGRILTLYLQTTTNKPLFCEESKNNVQISSTDDKSDISVNDGNNKSDEKVVADQGKVTDTLFVEKLPDCHSLLKQVPNNTVDGSILQMPIEPIKPTIQIQDICKIKLPLIIEIAKENLEFSDVVLGKGTFGTVQKGKWNGTKVAIKTVETLMSNPRDIIKEIAVLRQVTHENIVSLMGICSEDQYQIHIIMELVDGYSLRDIIYKEQVRNNFIKRLYDKNLISSQICRAITFLHLHPQHFLHRDIKPANILVTKNKIVKVCDLGLARMQGVLSQLQSTVGKRQIIGTPFYMAPEIFFRKSEYTQFADTWSLGCTLLEFYDGKPMWRISSSFSLEHILKNETVPDLKNVPEFLQQVLNQCFRYDFQKRPLAKELLKVFEIIENDN